MDKDDKPLVWLHGEIKTTRATPDNLIEKCKKRLNKYDIDVQD